MAKYCRYCGEKMSRPKDRFCYKCRREGRAVDRFYRKIPEEDKATLTEDEQDALRAEGIRTARFNAFTSQITALFWTL